MTNTQNFPTWTALTEWYGKLRNMSDEELYVELSEERFLQMRDALVGCRLAIEAYMTSDDTIANHFLEKMMEASLVAREVLGQ